MGFASFGFQNQYPLIDMHITQHFFWIFILSMVMGAGKFSLDYFVYNSKVFSNKIWQFIAATTFAVLLAVGLTREFSAQEMVSEEKNEVNSINIAGSFNDWNPDSLDMVLEGKDEYRLDLEFDKPGVIEFKFTANGSWDINWGEKDRLGKGFPISGIAEKDVDNDTGNIRAYIPAKSTYRFIFNTNTLFYSLDSVSTWIKTDN
jgi:hypothetical protein